MDPKSIGHIIALEEALRAFRPHAAKLTAWGLHLAGVLDAGGRLLACGNGGSAAQAQHLTGEIVGRYSADREPFSAIALGLESPALTAIGNDYGYGEVFARQVLAHGRTGDVLVLISTSGRSANVRRAARAGAARGLTTWALTGAWPNPLAAIVDDAITVDAQATCTIQEVHLVAIHMLCAAVDVALGIDEAAVTELVS